MYIFVYRSFDYHSLNDWCTDEGAKIIAFIYV